MYDWLKNLITFFEIQISLQTRNNLKRLVALIFYIVNGLGYNKYGEIKITRTAGTGVTSKSIKTKFTRNSGFSTNINIQENGVLLVFKLYQVKEVIQKNLFKRRDLV